MRFNEEGLYRPLEELLRKADKPLDCNQLFENKEIQKYAASPQPGLGLPRQPVASWTRQAPAQTRARPRWEYIWKDRVPAALAGVIDYVPKSLIDRPNLLISEEGDRIQIDLKEIVIIIQQRKKSAK